MKKIFLSNKQIKEITAEYKTPFHIYDEKGIIENAVKLKKAFHWNDGFKEYFAIKANPNPAIMEILVKQGCGMDASSFTELMLCERINLCNNQIMFSSNVTPKEDFLYAAKLGAIINLDDINHIEYLASIIDLPPKISCRYNPGGDFSFANNIMNSPKDAKYGFTYEQLVRGFKLLREKGVNEFGIHSFLASNTTDEKYYPELARLMFNTAVRLKKDTGISVSFINLSGGIGIPYLPNEKPADIMKIGNAIKECYFSILTPNNLDNISIFTELGRYMLAPFGHLVSKVLHKKKTYKNYVGLDSCAANLLRPAMYNAYHHITVMGKEKMLSDHVYDVTGGLCENIDKFAIDRELPKVEVDDILVIHDTGAHGHSMGYNYNGKLRSAEILLSEDGSVKLIRRAETAQDYLSTLDY